MCVSCSRRFRGAILARLVLVQPFCTACVLRAPNPGTPQTVPAARPAAVGAGGPASVSARRDPRGLSVGGATPPARLPVLRPSPSSTRAAATRFPTAWQPSPCFGRVGFRTASFRGPARRSLALQPAWRLNRPRRPIVVGVLSARCRCLHCPLQLLPAGKWRAVSPAHRNPTLKPAEHEGGRPRSWCRPARPSRRAPGSPAGRRCWVLDLDALGGFGRD